MMTMLPPEDDEDIPEQSIPKKYRNLYKKKEQPNLDYAMPTELKQSLDDVGTRYKHLSELHDLWSIGYDVLKGINASYETETDKQRIIDLAAGLRLLEKQMESLAGYQDKIYRLGVEINNLPNPENIKGD